MLTQFLMAVRLLLGSIWNRRAPKNFRDDRVTITTLHDRLEGGQIAIYFAAVMRVRLAAAGGSYAGYSTAQTHIATPGPPDHPMIVARASIQGLNMGFASSAVRLRRGVYGGGGNCPCGGTNICAGPRGIA